MVAKVVWLKEAVADLESIVEYISARSSSYDPVVAARILDEAAQLSSLPALGSLVREDASGRHRQLLCHSY